MENYSELTEAGISHWRSVLLHGQILESRFDARICYQGNLQQNRTPTETFPTCNSGHNRIPSCVACVVVFLGSPA